MNFFKFLVLSSLAAVTAAAPAYCEEDEEGSGKVFNSIKIRLKPVLKMKTNVSSIRENLKATVLQICWEVRLCLMHTSRK